MTAPPPPPPPGSRFNAVPSTKWDRRAEREDRRATKMAARQQRALTYQRMQAARRPSILGPLLLVGIGVAFLILETGTFQYGVLLLWLARWWPTVLLGSGLVLLVEWGIDTWVAGQNSPALPRRAIGGLGVLLLVLLTIAGLTATGLRHSAGWMRRNWNPDLADSWGLDQIFAQHTQIDQDLSAPMAAGGLLMVRNYKGDITISGDSPDNRVHVAVHQHLVAWRGEDLRSRRIHDRAFLKPNGSGLLLTAAGEGHDRTDLTIEVPHESGVEIDSETGQVTVSELHGPVNVVEHTGNIILTALTGTIHLSTRDDDAAVTGHSLSGDVTLDGRSGDLTFTDVTGSLALRGDFFGTTHLERINGPFHFHSSFTDFACASLPGELNIEGRSELQAKNVEGPLVLNTTDRNLVLSEVRRGATITDRNGSVTMTLAEPLAPLSVNTTAGAIDIRVPEKASFALSAETADGQVNNDLGLHPSGQDDHISLNAQVHRGGPTLLLRTTEGSINIHRKAEQSADDGEQANPDPN